MMKTVFAASLALCTASVAAQVSGDPVRVEGGLVSGKWAANAAVKTYLGIPYAAPPVGSLRWKEARPVLPWEGVHKADRLGNQCVQPERPADSLVAEHADTSPTSEDCLYLNVWAPAAAKKAPVMLWFFGGAWQAGSGGSSQFTQSNLAEQGVVLVTFNHRVGPFAFLAHPELSRESAQGVSGHYGLTDQLAAMQWVQKNIASFGGDPDNVTIFGQSSGASGVINQMATPHTRGLFHKAIAQSFGVRHMLTLELAERQGQSFQSAAGAGDLAALRAMPAEQVLAASLKSKHTFFPIADGWYMPEPVRDMFMKGRQQSVPLIIGWNKDEGTTYGFPGLIAERARLEPRFGARTDEAAGHYPGNSPEQVRLSSATLHADTMFGLPTWTAASAHGQKAPARTWLYHYAHKQPFFPGQRFAEFSNAPDLGAFHGAQNVYVFGSLQSLARAWTDEDREISRTLQAYFVNFARSGDPNGAGVPPWSTLGANPPATGGAMHIGGPGGGKMGAIPGLDRLRFLDSMASR